MDNLEIQVNAALLRWARENAGLSLTEAAARAKITPGRRKKACALPTPAERLNLWETGAEKPSLGNLQKLANAYRRPLITFFLKAPPSPCQIWLISAQCPMALAPGIPWNLPLSCED